MLVVPIGSPNYPETTNAGKDVNKCCKRDARVTFQSMLREWRKSLHFFMRCTNNMAKLSMTKKLLNKCWEKVGNSKPRRPFDLHEGSE